jgi:hypothetical protein
MNPAGWGTSDRNGMIGNLKNMRFQHDWRGPRIVNTRILVHEDELDEPQRQLGSPALLGPDPVPLANARPENYAIDEQPVSTRVAMGPSVGNTVYAVRVVMQLHGGAQSNLIATVPGGVTDGNWTGP